MLFSESETLSRHSADGHLLPCPGCSGWQRGCLQRGASLREGEPNGLQTETAAQPPRWRTLVSIISPKKWLGQRWVPSLNLDGLLVPPIASCSWQHHVDCQLLQQVHPRLGEKHLEGGCADTATCFSHPFLQLSSPHLLAPTLPFQYPSSPLDNWFWTSTSGI